jgi:hypothetical protein
MNVCLNNAAARGTRIASREVLTGVPVIFLVGDDWRIQRFIGTVLKYGMAASVLEATEPYAALAMSRKMALPIDLLILQLDLVGANNVSDLARDIAAENSSIKVLFVASRDCPACDAPPCWRFLSIPFTTELLLSSVNELCGRKAG